jgi:hypothetical protein
MVKEEEKQNLYYTLWRMMIYTPSVPKLLSPLTFKIMFDNSSYSNM